MAKVIIMNLYVVGIVVKKIIIVVLIMVMASGSIEYNANHIS